MAARDLQIRRDADADQGPLKAEACSLLSTSQILVCTSLLVGLMHLMILYALWPEGGLNAWGSLLAYCFWLHLSGRPGCAGRGSCSAEPGTLRTHSQDLDVMRSCQAPQAFRLCCLCCSWLAAGLQSGATPPYPEPAGCLGWRCIMRLDSIKSHQSRI